MKSINILVALSCLTAAACAGGDEPSEEPKGGVWSDMEQASDSGSEVGSQAGAPFDRGSGVSTDGVDADSSPPASQLPSNTPNARFVQGTDRELNVQIVSSNLMQEQVGNTFFQQWYAEIENTGADPVCLVSLEASFADGQDELANHYSFIDGSAYDGGSGLSLSTDCIGPGDRAGLYSNAIEGGRVDLLRVTEITLVWDGLVLPNAIPHPLTPTMLHVDVLAGRQIAGAMRNDGSAIYNLGITFYARGSDDLLFEQLFDTHLATLRSGATWNFDTLPAKGTIVDYLQGLSFIEGAR